MSLRCALSPTGGAMDESDHPVPTTASILPLQENNRWTYRYTTFDSTGAKEAFPDRTLDLAITGVYYLHNGRDLVRVNRHEHDYDPALRYIYRYEWESLDSGYLVYHQGTGDVNTRGLYITGTFVDTHTVLFDTARLWYAYPAGDVGSWQIDLPDGDTVSSMFECVSKTEAAWFGRPDANDPSPLVFIDSCYLYRQTIGDNIYFHCFHPAHGKVSVRHYYKGVLRESYLLMSESLFP
jgi:hypothetical protein